jgi:hypothetical protein
MKQVFSIFMMALSMLVFGTVTALASESTVVSETEEVENVLARENPQQELMDVVYFRSENGVVELSDDPFENENAKSQSNNVMTRAENVSSWNTNRKSHSGKIAVNSRS